MPHIIAIPAVVFRLNFMLFLTCFLNSFNSFLIWLIEVLCTFTLPKPILTTMKKIAIISIIAFIVFSCKQEQSQLKSDLVLANLKGSVWKIDKTIHKTGNSCGCVLKTDCNRSKYVYNEQGNLLTWYTVDEFGLINDSTNFNYNKRGICTKITVYNGKQPVGKQIPVLKGEKITGYNIYNEDGVIESTLNYIFTGDEITEEKTLNNKGEVISSLQKEILNGQLIEQTEKDNNGNVISTSTFKRNASNDISECLTVIAKDNKEFKLTYEYEYDGAGNWVKQTRLYDGAIISITLRNIEYYKYGEV
jgi:hypothetical protein